jgi:hypothetical protein
MGSVQHIWGDTMGDYMRLETGRRLYYLWLFGLTWQLPFESSAS